MVLSYSPDRALVCGQVLGLSAFTVPLLPEPHIAASIGVAISAFGAAKMASLTGITVADLEQLFGTHGDPDLYRLMKVLHVLGVSLSVTARTQ